MGGDWMLTTTSVYDDAKCALMPSKISYTVTATCTKPTAAADACKTTKSGSATVYVAPGCVKSTSYISTIDKAFGLNPYVVVESYSAQGCSGLTSVTAYVADKKCHNSAEASSYRAYSDPSTNTANIMMYSNADCGTFTISVHSTGIESPCTSPTTSDFKKVYIGGMVSKLTAAVTYSDADCTKPVQVVFASPITACSVKNTCTAATNGLYMKQGCTGDFAKYLTEIFKRTRHLVTELYDVKNKQSCETRQGIVAYVGDGVCHPNLDGTTSFKVTLGAANTDSATLVTYNDAVCTGTGTPLAISATNLASGLCDSATSIISTVGGESGPTAAPTTGPSTTPEPTTVTSTGSGTSSATTCLHLSTLGFMAITRGILGGIAIL